MRLPRRTTGLLLFILLAGMFASLARVHAQSVNSRPATAQLQLAAGDVLELFAMNADPAAGEDWVLTRAGEFVEAGRERIFRTRLTQEGPYLLDAQVRRPDRLWRMQMELTVLPPRGNEFTESPSGRAEQIVTTNPPIAGSAVHIPSESPVLSLTPAPGLTGSIAVDLDPGIDTDGDGDPRNDNDLADTLFSTEHNTIHLWFTEPGEVKALRLSTFTDDGTLLTQDIALAGGAAAVPAGAVTTTEGAGGVVRFSFGAVGTIDPATVVYSWDFGDGTQSLVEEPAHQYTTNGTYDIAVTVRDLATARVLAQGGTTVTVTTATGTAGASSAAASSVAAAPSGSGVGSFLWTLFKIAIVLLVCIALGAAGVRLAMRFLHREGRLQKALEQAEGKLLKTDAGSAATPEIAPATMRLKRPETTTERPTAPAEIIDQAPVSTTTQSPPPPPAMTEPLPPTPPPLPPPATAPTETSPPMEAPTPSWLQTPATPPPPLPSDTAPPETPPGAPATPASGQPVLSEDDLLPTWLRDEEVKEVKDVGEVGEVAEAPAPTMPDPSPPPSPAPTPSTVVPAPEPPPPPMEMTPQQPSSAMTPVPEPTMTAPASAPASPATTSTTVSPDDQARLERERDRKRRKRQRYRENLKKRNAAEQTTKILEGASETGQGGSPLPSSSPTPVPQDIPPAETPIAPTPVPEPEDKVTFMIKAEGVEKLNEENGNTSANGMKSAA